MAYVNNLQTSPTGFTPYFTSGQVFSTGALANGGAWYDASNPSGLHTTGSFLVGIAASSTPLKAFLVEGDLSSITFSDVEAGGSFIGEFDLRGTGAGYSGFGGAAGSQSLSASTDYNYALYREVTGAAGLSTLTTGKVGIGNDFADGWYEGTVTTDDTPIDFAATFSTGTQSGSGIRLGEDLTLSMGFMDRAGEGATSSEEFANNPYFTNLDIDIGTAPPITIVKTLYSGYRDTLLKFSEEENRSTKFPGEVDGAFTDNYTIRTRLTDVDGTISTGDMVIYGASKPELTETVVQDASGTFENSNSSNFVSPHPTAPNAQYLTSRWQLDSAGINGTILVEVNFPDGKRIAYDRIDLYGARNQGNSFPLKPANFLSSYDISAGQTLLQIFQKVGVASNTPYHYALVPYSQDGKTGATHHMGPFTLGEVSLGRDPVLYKNVPDQHVLGCFTAYDCLKVEARDSASPYLSVIGDSKGSGEGDRLTLNNVPYMLSGDAAASTGITLQGVTDNGNTTTNDVSVGMATPPSKTLDVCGSFGVYSDSYKTITSEGPKVTIASGAVGTAITADSTYGTVAIGTTAVSATDTLTVVGVGSTIPTLVVKGGVGTQAGFVGIGSSDPQHGFDASTVKSANVGAANSYINSTGSAILGGATHQISGDFDVIAGGILASISGGNFNFIGGGSGIDITGSQYSSSLGGYNNDIIQSNQSVIGGGRNNLIKFSNGNTIGGGHTNNIFSGQQSYVGGGYQNMITGTVNSSAIVGGTDNEIHDTYSFIGAGATNVIYDGGQGSVIAGGAGNQISGTASTVAGGIDNRLSGNYCFGMGYRAQVPNGIDGATVLADGQSRDHISSGSHTATLDFANGVYVPTTGFFNGLHVSGVPVSTGSAAEADTLQTVADRGNTTTTSILSTGPHISGVTGLFSHNVGVGTNSPTVELDVVGTGIFSEKVGIGTTPANALDVVGHLSATSKSFVIDHPTKENKKLQYGSLEGPEHSVFVRGTTNKNVIKLPDYWEDLVHEDSITVTLTPLHGFQSLYVKSKTPEQIILGGVKKSYDYVVYGERKDIDKLEVEPLKV